MIPCRDCRALCLALIPIFPLWFCAGDLIYRAGMADLLGVGAYHL